MSDIIPFGIGADLHFHNWQAFSQINEDGINTRLAGSLGEMKKAATAIKRIGGNKLILAGDIFHVRGSIAPTVLNPVKDTFKWIKEQGVDVIAIPGNHDLEGKHAVRVSSAVTALEDVGVQVINQMEMIKIGNHNLVLIPWHNAIADLRADLETLHADGYYGDVVMHAPINGVIPGLPDHGIEAPWLASLGFGRVYAGHYHNHKVLEGGKVISIGALTHTTFSDVGALAGFVVVRGDKLVHVPSNQPSFIDLTEKTATPEAVKGNYVRFKAKPMSDKERRELREELTKMGAAGVVIQEVREAAVSRDKGVVATVAAGASIETSVSSFCSSKSLSESVTKRALEVLAKARMEATE